MRRRQRFRLAAALLPLATAVAQPPLGAAVESPRGAVLEVWIAPGPHTVGDRIEAELTVSLPLADLEAAGTAAAVDLPRFPRWSRTWGEAEVLEVGTVERLDGGGGGGDDAEAGIDPGRAAFRQRLELAAFRPGELELPPVAVAVPLPVDASGEAPGETAEAELTTPAGLTLEIDSVLPAAGEGTEEPALAPPAPPRPLPLGTRFWIALATFAVACAAALAWAILARRRSAAGEAAAPPPPPFEELRAALTAARAEPSPEAGHTRLSLALRRYLGRALGFSAAERSTAEERRELSGRRLPDGAARRAVALLAGCDLIKFARRTAIAEELDERAGAALNLASEIEAHLHPVTAPGPAGRAQEAA